MMEVSLGLVLPAELNEAERTVNLLGLPNNGGCSGAEHSRRIPRPFRRDLAASTTPGLAHAACLFSNGGGLRTAPLKVLCDDENNGRWGASALAKAINRGIAGATKAKFAK